MPSPLWVNPLCTQRSMHWLGCSMIEEYLPSLSPMLSFLMLSGTAGMLHVCVHKVHMLVHLNTHKQKTPAVVLHFLYSLCILPCRNLVPVTQLYVSVDASTKESLKKIDRPLFRDFWPRFISSLEALSEKVHCMYACTYQGWENTPEEVETLILQHCVCVHSCTYNVHTHCIQGLFTYIVPHHISCSLACQSSLLHAQTWLELRSTH